MGDISEHFNRHEFSCHCGCGFAAVDKKLNEVLEDVRKYFDAPLTINSGCRCTTYNKKVGGAQKSQHVKGMAADITVMNIAPNAVADYLERAHKRCSVGRYDTFTHIDVRDTPTRWDNRSERSRI